MNFPLQPISSIATINPRQWTLTPNDDDLVSFIPLASVEANTGCLHPNTVRPWKEVSRGYTRFEEGDIVFAKITPSMENGKIAIAIGLAGGRAVGSTEYHVLRPSSLLSGRYLLHFLLQYSTRQLARSMMRGVAGQLRVPADFFSSIKIPVPPVDEQRQIVEAIETQFARLDAAVAALERARIRLKRYRASVLKAACEGRLVMTEAELARHEGRDYEPSSVLLERIRAERAATLGTKRGNAKAPFAVDTSELSELPEGWEWTRLGATIGIGPQNGIYKPASAYGSGVSIIRIDDFQDFHLRPRSELRTLRVSDQELQVYGLFPNDLVINRVNSAPQLGKCLIVPAALCPAVFESNMMRMHLSAGLVPQWVAFYLRSIDGRKRLTLNAKWAVNQASINQEDVRNTPLPVPPLAEQERIVAEVERRMSVIEQMEALVEANMKRAETLRQSILRLAFSGRLVASDVEQERVDIAVRQLTRVPGGRIVHGQHA